MLHYNQPCGGTADVLEEAMEQLRKFDAPGTRNEADEGQVVIVSNTKQVPASAFLFRSEISAVLGRIRNRLSQNAISIIHITSATSGEGVSTVARELVHAAAAMPWCSALLIDRNPGRNDQGTWFGMRLPDLIGSYNASGRLTVAAIDVGGAIFHAAKISPDAILDGQMKSPTQPLDDGQVAASAAPKVSISATTDTGLIYQPVDPASPKDAMPLAYNLVIVDCPPVLRSSGFLLLARQPADVLLVVRAEHTHISTIAAAKEQLAFTGSEISGVVINRWRRRVPRFARP